MVDEKPKGLSSGFLLFVGIAFVAGGIGFRYVIMDDPTDAPRSWMTSHAWLMLVIAGAALGVFAISKMVRR
jgi:succinate dehydrogenase hydrophobic anchor subunit